MSSRPSWAAGRWLLILMLSAIVAVERPAVSRAQAPATAAPGSPPQAAQGGADGITDSTAEPFEETIEVNVVSLDVVVRDASGNLVPGLTRADFRLLVDGKPVEITNFVAPQAAPATLGAPPPQAAAAPPAEKPAPPQPRHLVLFVDNANMRPFDRNRLLKQVRSFLEKTLRPDDQVLLVTHDPGLHVRGRFPGDVAALAPALDQLAKESAVGLNRDIAVRQELDDLRDTLKTSGGCGGGLSAVVGLARNYAESAFADARETYASLHHLLRSLGGLDGHKVLVYVGDGLATHAGTDVYGLLQDLCPAALHLTLEPIDATTPMRQVIADANANLVTLYTLEARGLDAYVSAEHAGKPLLSFATSRTVALDRQDSLLNLARETGGRAALNGNDFSRDLSQIADELDAAYSLGFTPARAGLGQAHAVRIEVDRPGARLSYRTSYRDRTPQERLDGQVEAALIHGQADNPLAATLKVGTAVPAEHGRILLPVQVRVPFSKLALISREDGRHGRIDIVFGNLDAQGGMAPLQRQQLPLKVPEADSKKVLSSKLGYDAKLLLAPGRQRLAFVVRDDLARVSSCMIQDLDVDKSGAVNLVVPAADIHAIP